MKHRLLSFVFPVLIASSVWAQAPAAAPAPASKPTPIATPPGYKRIDVSGKKVICVPEDEKWIRDAVAATKEPEHPTTRPSDLVTRLKANQDKLISQMVADLPGLTPAAVTEFLDKDLTPAMEKLRDVKIDLVYIVTPGEQLKNAMRAGWSAPNLYYNRVSDTIDFNPTFTPDNPNGGESVIPIGYNTLDPEKDRTKRISDTIQQINQDLENQLTNRGFMLLNAKFFQFIDSKAFGDDKSFPSKEDQIWLREGLANVLSVKYMSFVSGLPMEGVLQTMWVIPPNVNINPLTLDLLHPKALASYQPQFLGSVIDGRRRRATLAMYIVYTKDPAKIPALLTEIRAKNPSDGPTLADIVKSSTTVDIAPLLAAQTQ